MGRYKYTEGEQEINTVLKLNELTENVVKSKLNEISTSSKQSINESEELLRSLGYNQELLILKNMKKRKEYDVVPTVRSWSEILEEANSIIDYDVELEDILSEVEFKQAYQDLDRINEEFSSKVKLDKKDISFLFVATALQTLRWVLIPELGDKIDPDSRIDDKTGDKKVKQKKDDYAAKHNNRDTKKESQGAKPRKQEGKSWKEIIYSSVPYDATAGSPAQNVKMEGKYHRYKTLGHDPILGWIFGTANILTETITLNNFTSYRVEKMKFTSEIVPLPFIFQEAYTWVEDDVHRLPAAIFRQGLHLESDKYTKLGLPIPFLGVFSETLAGKLYKNQYDALCLAKDAKIVGASAGISILINMIISLVHGLFYNADEDGERDLYEVRTRQILMYSNLLASSANVITVCITKNPKKLDIGGLLVTISRLFTDVRFIAMVKEEFINAELDVGMQNELNEADRLFLEGL